MIDADELREQLIQAGRYRAACRERFKLAEYELGEVLCLAKEHPKLTMTEAIGLAGIKRRATAYQLADRASR